MGTYGGSCSNRTSETSGTRTRITALTVGETGIITSFCCYMTASGNIKLKIFRSSGSDWVFVGESDLKSVSVGLNSSLSCSISVQNGDYIGFYIESSAGIESDEVYAYQYDVGYEVTGTLAKSSWNYVNYNHPHSLQVTVSACSTYDDVYVHTGAPGDDANCGQSSLYPVKTFARAYVLLNASGTIHVLNSGADFSAETVTRNKSYYIDLNGASGYFYDAKAT